MYCTTHKGKEALVRQLGAELHIETEFQIIKSLLNFMNKFHVVKHPSMPAEIDQLTKDNKTKLILFKSADAYANKIRASL